MEKGGRQSGEQGGIKGREEEADEEGEGRREEGGASFLKARSNKYYHKRFIRQA